jgi:putative methionine-R-sulfoxide reductase with GAF domain
MTTHDSTPHRDYAALRSSAVAIAHLPSRDMRMEAFAELWWNAFSTQGVSWAGFYIDCPTEPDSQRMVLGARRPGPACSPIGIHGACGQCLTAGKVLVVRDVADLGEGYIACDPRDRSELVVPCFGPEDRVWGVFDIDSHQIGSFSTSDATACQDLLGLAGLTIPPSRS